MENSETESSPVMTQRRPSEEILERCASRNDEIVGVTIIRKTVL